MMLTDWHQIWSKLNIIVIKCGVDDIVSLVPSVSEHLRMSEVKGHKPMSLTFFNLIHQMTALSCLVSRSRFLLPVRSGDCSLKHTKNRMQQVDCGQVHVMGLSPITHSLIKMNVHRDAYFCFHFSVNISARLCQSREKWYALTVKN